MSVTDSIFTAVRMAVWFKVIQLYGDYNKTIQVLGKNILKKSWILQ